MARDKQGRRRMRGAAQAGFTLLELLVALTLLGLIFAVVFGELRFTARAWDAADAKLDRNAELISVHSFLRQRLQQVRAAPGNRRRTDAESTLVFSGNSSAMTFVGTMPDAVSVGGFYEIALSVETGTGGDDLVISWHPYDEQGTAAATDGPENLRQLLTGLREVRFAYFGRTGENTAPQWWDIWPSPETTPSLIRVRMSFEDGDPRTWPELVVAPAAAHAVPTLP